MKKITPIVIAILIAAAFTSCKKDYTCTCKNKDGQQVASYTIPKAKKKDAKTACDTWNNGLSISGGSCSLD